MNLDSGFSPAPKPRLKKTSVLAGGLFFLAFGLVIYAPGFHAPFELDDAREILQNARLHHLANIPLVWEIYKLRFLTALSFAADYHFHQDSVEGYHAVNFAVHFLASLMAAAFSFLVLKTAERSGKSVPDTRLTACFAALIFLAHPVQTQAVTYIVQRAASLAALFYLAAFNLYASGRLRGSGRAMALSWLTALAAMFTKPIAFTLPLALLLYEILFFKDEPRTKTLRRLFPFLLLLAVIPFLTQWESLARGTNDFAVAREPLNLTHKTYALTQINVARTYLRLLVFPRPQNIDYDYPLSHAFFETRTVLSALLAGSVLAAGFLLRRKKPAEAFGIFWIFLTLAVESGPIVLGDVIFEHRLYLPMAGFGLLAASAAFGIFRDRRKAAAVLGVIVLALGARTYQRNQVWADPLRLWLDAASQSPRKPRVLNNAGLIYLQRHEDAKALSYFEKAVALDPKFASAWQNLGVLYENSGRKDQAERYYLKAIEAAPAFADPYNSLCSMKGLAGKEDEARAYCVKAVERDPDRVEALMNLAFLETPSNPAQAARLYERAVLLEPRFVKAYNGLGLAYEALGRDAAAREAFQKAQALGSRAPQTAEHLAALEAKMKAEEK
ncbi:MAG TPA: tetratricopeptide repeat protein [Verrucomicrobiae bacterium]|jgi:Flp pilus assembly protein TadD|nr:tetratricopeptide repeat protein [Verrucomicrobiae bacterium]